MNVSNDALKKVLFIQEFLKHLEDPLSKIFVLDEVGFGTKVLRNYVHHPVEEVKQEHHLHSMHKQGHDRDAEILQRR